MKSIKVCLHTGRFRRRSVLTGGSLREEGIKSKIDPRCATVAK